MNIMVQSDITLVPMYCSYRTSVPPKYPAVKMRINPRRNESRMNESHLLLLNRLRFLMFCCVSLNSCIKNISCLLFDIKRQGKQKKHRRAQQRQYNLFNNHSQNGPRRQVDDAPVHLRPPGSSRLDLGGRPRRRRKQRLARRAVPPLRLPGRLR